MNRIHYGTTASFALAFVIGVSLGITTTNTGCGRNIGSVADDLICKENKLSKSAFWLHCCCEITVQQKNVEPGCARYTCDPFSDKDATPDAGTRPADMKSDGFGCQAALANVEKIGRTCWTDPNNFTNGKADAAKVLACQIDKDLIVFGSIKTPNGKGQYSLVLGCMKGACPKGGVLTFTDKFGVTIDVGFDATYACINDLVHGNNQACVNQVATCADDGQHQEPMAQAPLPGGGISSDAATKEVCIDIPAWPSTQPLPGDNGVICVDGVCVDVTRGGRVCMAMPGEPTTGIVN